MDSNCLSRNIKITIIVPVYNVENYLIECLTSILKQSYKNFIAYLINDGSTDKSLQIIEKFVRDYPETFTLINKTNGGLSDARNEGIKGLCTEYVTFIDSDDIIDVLFLEKMYEIITKHKADIVNCGFVEYFEETKQKNKFSDCFDLFKLSENPDIIYNYPVMAWGKLYKSSLFIDNLILFPDKLKHEDNATMPRLVSRCDLVVNIPDCLYIYRKRKGSITDVISDSVPHLFIIADLLKTDNYYLKYKDQFDACRIGVIVSALTMALSKKYNKKVIKEAYSYLYSINCWKNNPVCIRKYKAGKWTFRLHWFFIKHNLTYMVYLINKWKTMKL